MQKFLNVIIHKIMHCMRKVQNLSNLFSCVLHTVQTWMNVNMYRVLHCMQYMDDILGVMYMMKILF